MDTLHQPLAAFSHTGRIKKYADGSYQLMVCTSPVFRVSGWEHEECSEAQASEHSGTTDPAANLDRARRRAAQRCKDLALSNDFRWFVTLTLDGSRIDRYDPSEIVRRMNRWLDNRVRNDGLAYVLVPELHKDGAVHFHGFFNDSLTVQPSGCFTVPGHKRPVRARSQNHKSQLIDAGGIEIYNLPQWDLGFTTAIPIHGDYHAAVGYMLKYVRKQGQKIGGRWFYHGGKLQEPTVEYTDDIQVEDLLDAGAYSFAASGMTFAIVEGGGKNA